MPLLAIPVIVKWAAIGGAGGYLLHKGTEAVDATGDAALKVAAGAVAAMLAFYVVRRK